MEMPNTPLEPVDEDWSSALAIVAHPDDLEFGAASAIARWTAQGKRIGYVMATRGEAGIDSIMPEETGQIREQKNGNRLASSAWTRSSSSTFPTASWSTGCRCGTTLPLRCAGTGPR